MENKPKVIVISHERSGTHFMMNSLSECFDYVSSPWVNFDFPQTAPQMICPPMLNFFHKESMGQFLVALDEQHHNQTIKSHHTMDFFKGILGNIFAAGFKIIYMYRNPIDVMLSQHSLVASYPRFEGPKTPTVSEFIRSEPAGWMMRYQYYQKANMLKRWEHHVNGWINYKHRDVIHVAYEELNDNYTTTMKRIGKSLGLKGKYVRPSKGENVISGGNPNYSRDDYDEEDFEFFQSEVGETMAKLNYTIDI